VAEGLAAELEQDAVLLAGVDYATYLHSAGVSRPKRGDMQIALLSATDGLFASSQIDVGFQVPYVAGYDRRNGAYVLIDCSVPLGPILGRVRASRQAVDPPRANREGAPR
jgi:hypothetical protein